MMFMDYFGFLRWIFGKMDQMSKKSGQAVGVLHCSVETHTAMKAHAKACGMPRRRMAEWEAGQVSGSPRRSRNEVRYAAAKPLFTAWKIAVFWFCFVSVAPRTCLLDK